MSKFVVFGMLAIAAVALTVSSASAQGMGGRTIAQLCPPAQNGPVNLLACNTCNGNAATAASAGQQVPAAAAPAPADIAAGLQAVRVGNGNRFAAVGNAGTGSSASSAASSGNGANVGSPTSQLQGNASLAGAPACERRRPVASALAASQARQQARQATRQANRLSALSARQGKPIAIAQAPAGGSASASAAN